MLSWSRFAGVALQRPDMGIECPRRDNAQGALAHSHAPTDGAQSYGRQCLALKYVHTLHTGKYTSGARRQMQVARIESSQRQ